MNNVVTETYMESVTLNIGSPILPTGQQTPRSLAAMGAGVIGVATVSGAIGYVVSLYIYQY
jgi:hypothetical protein